MGRSSDQRRSQQKLVGLIAWHVYAVRICADRCTRRSSSSFPADWGLLCERSSPLWHMEPANVKTTSTMITLAGWLGSSTARIFDQVSIPAVAVTAHTPYSYAQLIMCSIAMTVTINRSTLHLPTKGWPGWVGLGSWLNTQNTNEGSYISVLAWFNIST